MLLSPTWTVLAVKDMLGGTAEDLQGEAVEQLSARIERLSAWLPNTSLLVLAALCANVDELGRLIGLRNSEDDAIKPAQVTLFNAYIAYIKAILLFA